MAPVDRSNYINREMMCAATMYEMFINTITQNDDGTLSNLGDISLNYLEYVASDSSRVFLDLLVAKEEMLKRKAQEQFEANMARKKTKK